MCNSAKNISHKCDDCVPEQVSTELHNIVELSNKILEADGKLTANQHIIPQIRLEDVVTDLV